MTKSLVKKRIVLQDNEEVMVLNIVLEDVVDIMINNHTLTRLKSSRQRKVYRTDGGNN